MNRFDPFEQYSSTRYLPNYRIRQHLTNISEKLDNGQLKSCLLTIVEQLWESPELKQSTDAKLVPEAWPIIIRNEITTFLNHQPSPLLQRIKLLQNNYRNEGLYHFLLDHKNEQAEQVRKVPFPILEVQQVPYFELSTLQLIVAYLEDISLEDAGFYLREVFPERYEAIEAFNSTVSAQSERSSDSSRAFNKVKTAVNQQLADHFDSLAQEYERSARSGDKKALYQGKAFRTVAQIIREFKTPITSSDQLDGIRGVGKSSKQEIDEWLATHTSSRREELSERSKRKRISSHVSPEEHEQTRETEEERVVKQFVDYHLHGLGLERARKLYQDGYRDYSDLVKDPKGLLTNDIRTAIKYREETQQRIPRAVVDRIVAIFEQQLKGYTWVVAGSYRRGKESTGDIDLNVLNPDPTKHDNQTILKRVLKRLDPEIVATFTPNGKVKWMGIVRFKDIDNIHHRMDVRIFAPKEWAFGLLRITGSAQFNQLMSQRAIDLGYRLSEFRLQNTRTGQDLPAATEAEIFKLLGVRYYPPEERESPSQLALL
jgi:DNA polymerase beta